MAGKQKVASLYAELGADSRPFDAGMQRMQGALGRGAEAFRNMGSTGQDVLAGMGMQLGKFAGPAGIGLMVAAVGKGLFALNAMREESAMMEARATGLAGGARNLADGIAAMDAAMGRALTTDEKMVAVAQMLSTKVAGNVQEAANLARGAGLLGDQTESVMQRIEGLTQILVTGRTMGLVQYGISVQEVEARAAELKATMAGLTDEESKAIAIKEQIAQKMKAVEEAGGEMETSIGELKVAWTDFKDELAEKVDLEAPIKGLAAVIENVTNAMTEQGKAARDVKVAIDAYTDASGKVYAIQQQLADPMIEFDQMAKNRLQTQLEEAKAVAAAAQANMDYAFMMEDVAKGVYRADDAERDYIRTMEEATQKAKGLAGAMNVLALTKTALSVLKFEGMGEADYEPMDVQWKIGQDAVGGGDFTGIQQYNQARIAAAEAAAAAEETAARRAGSAWRTEFDQVASARQSEIASMLSEAQGFSTQLANMMGGAGGNQLAPGANGPFEAIYRAQAVAVGGIENADEEAWAKMYNLTPETAAEIVRKFQQGIFDPSVTGLIDKGAIAEMIQAKELAAATQEAFVAELAAASGGQPLMIKAMLGLGGGTDGGAAAGGEMAASAGGAGQAWVGGFVAAVQGADWATLTYDALTADFDQGVQLFQTSGEALGRTVATAIKTGVTAGMAGVRLEIAAMIAPEVAKILASQNAGKAPKD